jgi:hypothetical protein
MQSGREMMKTVRCVALVIVAALSSVAHAQTCCCQPYVPLTPKSRGGTALLVVGSLALAGGIITAVVGTSNGDAWNKFATVGTLTAGGGVAMMAGGIALYVSDSHDRKRELAIAPNGLIGRF